jgi:phosphopantetheinyl transferase
MRSLAPPRPLGSAEIVVATVGLSEIALESALELLSEAELERVRRITCRSYFLQVVKARGLLRVMLARCSGRPAESFEFDEGADKPPRLLANQWGLHFSVSHSVGQVAVALSRTPVGVDIERVRADCSSDAIAAICFHASERALLQSGDETASCEAFFEIWTRKEAYLKGIGTGLSTNPASFSTLAPDGAVATDASHLPVRTWFTRAIEAPAGYKAALATHWPRPCLTCFRLGDALPYRGRTRTGGAPARLPAAVTGQGFGA